jgi:hypothetical protein
VRIVKALHKIIAMLYGEMPEDAEEQDDEAGRETRACLVEQLEEGDEELAERVASLTEPEFQALWEESKLMAERMPGDWLRL